MTAPRAFRKGELVTIEVAIERQADGLVDVRCASPTNCVLFSVPRSCLFEVGPGQAVMQAKVGTDKPGLTDMLLVHVDGYPGSLLVPLARVIQGALNEPLMQQGIW